MMHSYSGASGQVGQGGGGGGGAGGGGPPGGGGGPGGGGAGGGGGDKPSFRPMATKEAKRKAAAKSRAQFSSDPK